jgi:hypothetical protein
LRLKFTVGEMGVDLAWIDKLKVAEIRSELEKRGVAYTKKARKSDIADLLRNAIEKEVCTVESCMFPSLIRASWHLLRTGFQCRM